MPRHAEDRRTAPDLAAVAETLGVTEEALKTALGDPQQGPPDLAAAAAQLGVAEEALTDALGVSGRPGNAPRPDDRPKLDIAGAAEALGVTEAELIAALRLPQGGAFHKAGAPSGGTRDDLHEGPEASAAGPSLSSFRTHSLDVTLLDEGLSGCARLAVC